jgi:hypothetical protein
METSNREVEVAADGAYTKERAYRAVRGGGGDQRASAQWNRTASALLS